MFDLRYHVASLAAVFFALIIGILVGVALASHGLGEGERDRLQEDLRRAENRGDDLQAELDERVQSNASDRAFVDKTYNLLMDDRLKEARIAVLYVGSVDTDVQSAITSMLKDAAGAQLRLRVLTVPINEEALARRLNGRPFLEAYSGVRQLDDLGEALGQEFTAGVETPIWNALETLIVERKDGPFKRPADGVIVVRTVPPQTGQTASFLKGLYRGIREVGVPAVGVEVSGGNGSAVEAFKKAELSTVDNVDTPVGKLTLAILLGAGATGNFGTKDPPSDDGVLPNVPPVTTITTGG